MGSVTTLLPSLAKLFARHHSRVETKIVPLTKWLNVSQ